MDSCKMCGSEVGVEWSQKLQRGEVRPMDAALHFNMTISDVNEHMINHDITVAVVERKKFSEKIQDPNYLLDKVEMVLNRLETTLDNGIDLEDDLDAGTIKLTALLTKEIRETLKLVFELQGKFKHGDIYHQQFIKIEGNYNLLISAITGGMLCEECQEKMLNKLETTKLIESIK